MAYDEHLAQRVRELVGARSGVTEKKMFGGIAWMINGNMATGVTSTGGLIVRVEPDETETLTREPHVTVFGRAGSKPMKGFVVVDAAAVSDDAALADWVDRGANRAASLPPK
jgi:TfoX/Sxy family transcriptional regulator of competence genes